MSMPIQTDTYNIDKPLCPWCGHTTSSVGFIRCDYCGQPIHTRLHIRYVTEAVNLDWAVHVDTTHGGDDEACDCEEWEPQAAGWTPARPDLNAGMREEYEATEPLRQARIVGRHWQDRVVRLLASVGYSAYGLPDEEGGGLAWHPSGNPVVDVPGLYVRPYLWDFDNAGDGTIPPANLEWHGPHPLRLWWYKYALRDAYADRAVDDTYLAAVFNEIETAITAAANR